MTKPALVNSYIPNLCRPWPLFSVSILAEMVVVIVVIAPGGTISWERFSVISVFCLWLALVSSVFICVAHNYLPRLNQMASISLCVVTITLVTLFGSSLIFTVDVMLGLQLVPIETERFEFVIRNSVIGCVMGIIALRYFYIIGRWQKDIEAQAEARVQALQARIRPHFLFNSMNSIASLISESPEKAEAVVEDLSDLFRSSLKSSNQDSNLGAEIDLIKRYLNIEHVRLGKRLQIEWAIDTLPMSLKLPGFMLQPLVENAIYHGIQSRLDGGVIKIEGCVAEGRATIVISNPIPNRVDVNRHQGNQMAQKNIQQRLDYRFAGSASFAAVQTQDMYQVTLIIPVEQ